MEKYELPRERADKETQPARAQRTSPAEKYFFRLLIAILLIILMLYIAVPKNDFDIGPSTMARPVDTAIWELNGRENLIWADAKISDKQFLTDADIDNEIVHARYQGSLYTDLGPDYEWTVAPTATGGTLLYKSREEWVFYRTPATLEKEATWSTWRDVPLPPVVGHYACVGIQSGDTIIVIHDGTKKALRLMGIDAPQAPFCENKTGQPYSRESTDYLADMVLNKNVKTVLYKLEGGYRSLGVVFVENKNVNLEMIKAGLAEVDLRNRFPGFDLQPYFDTEKKARNAGLGMWSLGDCYLSPWDWKISWRAREKALNCE